jgi:predicted DNA-binding protein
VAKLTPETGSRLQELSKSTGTAPYELVEDAMSGYLAELSQFTRPRNKNHSQWHP